MLKIISFLDFSV
uniref:Uncharacterized protein n=1 Tax=Rhizophora mucronata TaxID=61149 RepID=A0A2P2QBH7_RHIMU